MSSFADFQLRPPLLRALADLGFETPSPIQAATLPILLGESTDFMGLAATGTGKTAAFSIPLLERMNPDTKGVQALILCPTRELALQVAQQISQLGKYLSARTTAVYGGAPYGEQIRALREGTSVVVGTPGRVVDHIEKGTLDLSSMTTLVFDEADEMISMGFKDDLEKILEAVPMDSVKFWMFSATMSPEVRRVGDRYLRSPKHVQLNKETVLSSTVQQFYYPAQESNKPEILCKLIEAADDFYGLVFCQTKALTVDLTEYLQGKGYRVDSLHGDKDQNARERTMQAFRDRKTKILICTDVASRGLDVKDVTHVINYSLPRELDNYVHRIGRTGRSGKPGIAMNLVTYSHRGLISRIERMTKSRMVEGRLPTRKEIASRKVSIMLPQFENQPFQNRAQEILSPEWRERLAGLSAEEVAARFLAMSMPDLFNDRDDERPSTRPEPRFRTTDERPARDFDRRDERPRSGRERAGEHRAERGRDREYGNRREDGFDRSSDRERTYGREREGDRDRSFTKKRPHSFSDEMRGPRSFQPKFGRPRSRDHVRSDR